MGKLIALIGNTGIGKTSLARALAQTGEFDLRLEQHSTRPFQTLFKLDTRFALANQIDYLLLRAEQERMIRQTPQVGLIDGGLDQDFHGFTRLFHTRAMINDAEYELCNRLYNFIRSQLPLPDLIIHLTASDQVIRERLATRDRINIAGLADIELLDTYLKEWLFSLNPEQVLHLDISSASASYQEITPGLRSQIRERLGLDIVSYDTGYIP